MSAVSDKIKEVINDQIVGTRKNMDGKVNKVIKGMRSGEGQLDKLAEIEKDMNALEEVKQKVRDAVDRVKSILVSLKAGKDASEASRKASVIGSALNPAAAAIAHGLEFIINKATKEIKDIRDAVNVVPPILDNLEKFVDNTNRKLEKEKNRKEAKKRLADERKNMLV